MSLKEDLEAAEARIEELEGAAAKGAIVPADVGDVVLAIRAVQEVRGELSLAGTAQFKRLLAKHAPQYQALMVPVRRSREAAAAEGVIERTAEGKRKRAALENAALARNLAAQADANVRAAESAARA